MSQVLSWKDKLVASMVNEQRAIDSSRTKATDTPAVGRSVQKNVKRSKHKMDSAKRSPVKRTILPPSMTTTSSSTKTSRTPPLTLHTKWGLYYHNPNSNDWSNDSYKRISQLNTVDAFCVLYKEMDFQECAQGMFFLMRSDIMPTWEDTHNRNGGCWSFKVSLEHFFYVWKNLSMMLVGETLCKEPMLLNGISVSPKRGFCIVKLWNRDSKHTDTSVLHLTDVKYLEDNGPALYTPFNAKK